MGRRYTQTLNFSPLLSHISAAHFIYIEFDQSSKGETMLRRLLKFTVVAAATAIISAATYVSSVKLAEATEKMLEDREKNKQNNSSEDNQNNEQDQ